MWLNYVWDLICWLRWATSVRKRGWLLCCRWGDTSALLGQAAWYTNINNIKKVSDDLKKIHASGVYATVIAVYITWKPWFGLLQPLSLETFTAKKATSSDAIAHFPELPFGVNTFVCTSMRDSHREPHITYPTVKHLLCKALIKASGVGIDKPFLTTAA